MLKLYRLPKKQLSVLQSQLIFLIDISHIKVEWLFLKYGLTFFLKSLEDGKYHLMDWQFFNTFGRTIDHCNSLTILLRPKKFLYVALLLPLIELDRVAVSEHLEFEHVVVCLASCVRTLLLPDWVLTNVASLVHFEFCVQSRWTFIFCWGLLLLGIIFLFDVQVVESQTPVIILAA